MRTLNSSRAWRVARIIEEEKMSRDESGMLASGANQYEANQYESNQYDATTGRFRRAWCDIKANCIVQRTSPCISQHEQILMQQTR